MTRATMHAKTDSEGTSLDALSPPRSPRRPLYYVQSPSNHDVEKMSYGSSPMGSPPHHFYHSSPINHSRESSTSRYSAPLKSHASRLGLHAWKKIPKVDSVGHGGEDHDDDDDVDEDADEMGNGRNVRLCFCFVLLFVALFSLFSLILWSSSKAYRPKIFVKNIVFEKFNVQAGSDQTGVPTDMLSINSTVRILYRNPATFFGVHVTSTPLELFYYDLKVAYGDMKKFYQPRQSQRTVVTVVRGDQIPVYGSVPIHVFSNDEFGAQQLPLNLTFVMRSRAYILGMLVKSKFYHSIRCSAILRADRLGKPLNLTRSCIYQ